MPLVSMAVAETAKYARDSKHLHFMKATNWNLELVDGSNEVGFIEYFDKCNLSGRVMLNIAEILLTFWKCLKRELTKMEGGDFV